MKTNHSLFDKHEDLQHLIENSDHIDVKTIQGNVTLREFISGCISYHPKWMLLLFRTREILVKAGIKGLKTYCKDSTIKVYPGRNDKKQDKMEMMLNIKYCGMARNLNWGLTLD